MTRLSSIYESEGFMPTDHGPELAALAKRLADAKEFL
jgi:hypothetical protein